MSEAPSRCPKCGEEIGEANFCPNCGFQFAYHLDAIILSRLFGRVETGARVVPCSDCTTRQNQGNWFSLAWGSTVSLETKQRHSARDARAGLPKTMSIVCRTLFETGCRIGELHQIERKDVNEETCVITIQHPEKNSNPRPNRVSAELIGLLKTLPAKHGSHLFNPKKCTYDGMLNRQRKRVADRNGKPQFLQIHFHTFRHARASLDPASGIPLEEIKENLGHKSILNTERYAHWNKQLYQQKNERYYCRAVSSDENAGKLIEEGWTYVCTSPSNGHLLFRKPK